MTDFDGMPLAPVQILEYSPWTVFGPAFRQARLWTAPKEAQKKNLNTMLGAFAASVLSGGPSKDTTKTIMECAEKLKLQVKRVIVVPRTKNSAGDSYLIFYTKPRVTTYNGPFLCLRETSPSKVVILSPHDGGDGTHASTKLLMNATKALAVISNGHPKGINPKADFVDHGNTLGNIALRQLQAFFSAEKLVVLMIHGMKNKTHVLYRSRSNNLANAFERGIKASTNITKFGTFNASYVTDKTVNSSFYLKCEIPVRVHMNNAKFMNRVVATIEEEPWSKMGSTELMSSLEESIEVSGTSSEALELSDCICTMGIDEGSVAEE